LALGLARLEKLLDPRQTCRDVEATCHTTGVERTHGELRPWLADGLRRHDPDRVADLDHRARPHVPAVAHLAHAMARFARHWRANLNLGNSFSSSDPVPAVLVHRLVAVDDDFTR